MLPLPSLVLPWALLPNGFDQLSFPPCHTIFLLRTSPGSSPLPPHVPPRVLLVRVKPTFSLLLRILNPPPQVAGPRASQFYVLQLLARHLCYPTSLRALLPAGFDQLSFSTSIYHSSSSTSIQGLLCQNAHSWHCLYQPLLKVNSVSS